LGVEDTDEFETELGLINCRNTLVEVDVKVLVETINVVKLG